MAPRDRALVRAGLLAFALLTAALQGVQVHEAVIDLAHVEPGGRGVAMLALVGAGLTTIGLTGLYVAFAIGVEDWSSRLRVFAVAVREPGSRRAWRQIAGTEPYAPADLPRLRRLARWRADLLGPARWTRWSAASTLTFLTGLAVHSPLDDIGAPWAVAGRAFQVAAAVVAGVLMVSLLVRRRPDAEARSFLARTAALVPDEPGTRH